MQVLGSYSDSWSGLREGEGITRIMTGASIKANLGIVEEC